MKEDEKEIYNDGDGKEGIRKSLLQRCIVYVCNILNNKRSMIPAELVDGVEPATLPQGNNLLLTDRGILSMDRGFKYGEAVLGVGSEDMKDGPPIDGQPFNN